MASCLFAKKAKSKHLLVAADSLVSGHRRNIFRERTADKAEFFDYDPFIGQPALYREVKKIRSASWKELKPWVGLDPFKL